MPKIIKPRPVNITMVVTPALIGLTRIKIENNIRRIPPAITIPLPETLNVAISPPKAMMMKL